jgi:hypothetical protein
MEKRRPLRRQPNDHNFGSLLMLAVTDGAFLVMTGGIVMGKWGGARNEPRPGLLGGAGADYFV